MTDPFALALDALFHAPGSAEAIYYPADGSPARIIRVIRSAPDREVRFGQGSVLDNAGTVIELRRAEVSDPKNGDMVVIDGSLTEGVTVGQQVFKLFGDPVLDLERITWTCGANEA